MAILDSLLVQLGFEVNTEKVEEFKQKTEELKKSVMSVGMVMGGAALGLGLLVEKVAGSMGELYSFAELNEVSARSVQALGKIAVENDSSMEGMKSTIQSLNRVVGEAALGVGRGAALFEKLGMSAKNADGSVKKVDDILGEVADRMQGLSRQEQIALAQKLGIDPQLVKVLGQGAENLAKLREEAELFNPMKEEDYKLADEVDKLFIKAKSSLGVFTKMIGVSLLPVAKEVLKTYLEWFKESRKATSGVVIQGIQGFVAVLSTLWDWTRRVVLSIRESITWLTQFKVVTYAAAAAVGFWISLKAYDFVTQLGAAIRMLTLRVATFNIAAMVIPAIIGAIIIALGLLLDDYVNWKEGNDSVLGGLIEKFPLLLQIIQGIEKFVGNFVDQWIEQWNNLREPVGELASSIWELISQVASALWPVVKLVFEGWAYIAAAVIPILVVLIKWITEGLVWAIGLVIKVLTTVVDVGVMVFGVLGSVINGIVGLIEGAVNRVFRFVEAVSSAAKAVGKFFGLTGDSEVKVAAAQAGTSGSGGNGMGAPGGVLGRAVDLSNSSAQAQTTNQTNITGTTIQINSPDPAKAGESVKSVMDQMARDSIRNGQSAVAL